MTPQHQEIVGQPGRGDCVRACVATLLNLPIASVPNFIEGRGAHQWYRYLVEWLKERGIAPVVVSRENWSASSLHWAECLCIATGVSPRRAVRHAVVWQLTGWSGENGDGKMVFDPHPDGTGLVGGPDEFIFFVPCDPGRLVQS